MAELVGGFLVPHCPMIFTAPDAPSAEQKASVLGAYATVAARIRELRATAAIVIGSDHYILFGPSCLPQMLIAIGDVDGPLERLPGIERGAFPTNQNLARHLFEAGCDAGFDWAVAKAITVDHAIAIPYHLCLRDSPDVAVIPVYLNSGVDPAIRFSRARALGTALRNAVEAWPEPERVVILGTGGISHWVGTAEMGKVNPEFDRGILDLVEAGDLDALVAMDDREVLQQGGNGALEVRNFICAMGAVAPFRGRTIAYEAVPAWITGLGFAELSPVS